MSDYAFEVGQILEMVHGEKEENYLRNVIRRFISNEKTIDELIEMRDSKDGDLVKVHERRMKDGHDLYLCLNLRTNEYTLFGRSGLRLHNRMEK